MIPERKQAAMTRKNDGEVQKRETIATVFYCIISVNLYSATQRAILRGRP